MKFNFRTVYADEKIKVSLQKVKVETLAKIDHLRNIIRNAQLPKWY